MLARRRSSTAPGTRTGSARVAPARRAARRSAVAVEAQLGHGQRRVVDVGALRRARTRGCRSPSCGCRRSAAAGRRARTDRTRPTSLMRAGGVRREDGGVLVRRRVEVVEHRRAARRSTSVGRRRSTSGCAECGLPKTLLGEQLAHARATCDVGVEAAAGVVEIHVPLRVEPAVSGARSSSSAPVAE